MSAMQWEAVRASAQWAAYGDALGFITELTDAAAGVRRRIGHDEVTTTVPLEKPPPSGDATDATCPCPAGAYSDDTQLRLATSRAIRGDGEFDAEAFAKIEVVAWQAYALGAGRGTKAAATGLMRVEAKWSQNIFATKAARYVDIGGNGAAMRIQPHVWSARDLTNWDHITRDVVRNAVSTHGHPRGILGAVLHAVLLAHTLDANELPGPSDRRPAIDWLEQVPDVIAKDDELAYLWLPTWTDAAGTDFRAATLTVADECARTAFAAVDSATPLTPETYTALVEPAGRLRAMPRADQAQSLLCLPRCSHTPTPAPQKLGCSCSRQHPRLGHGHHCHDGWRSPRRCHSSSSTRCRTRRRRHHSEARRMWDISRGRETATFAYPDLLRWSPPKATLDLVGQHTNGRALAGLGTLTPVGTPTPGNQATYVWGTFPLDKSVLVRARPDLRPLDEHLLPGDVRQPRTRQSADAAPTDQQLLFDTPTSSAVTTDQGRLERGAAREP